MFVIVRFTHLNLSVPHAMPMLLMCSKCARISRNIYMLTRLYVISRPIYKYDLDALPMLLMRSLIDGRLNFKNCHPLEYELHVKNFFLKMFLIQGAICSRT